MVIDRKEVDIISYLELEEEKGAAERAMANNPVIAELKNKINVIKEEMNLQEFKYTSDIHNCELAMQRIKEKIVEEWDTEDKSCRYTTGSATLRITRSLKVDDKKALISTLQHIGKLTQCISGWNLTYLRKLADVGMLDVDGGEPIIAHYDEKKSVVISGVKNEEKK